MLSLGSIPAASKTRCCSTRRPRASSDRSCRRQTLRSSSRPSSSRMLGSRPTSWPPRRSAIRALVSAPARRPIPKVRLRSRRRSWGEDLEDGLGGGSHAGTSGGRGWKDRVIPRTGYRFGGHSRPRGRPRLPNRPCPPFHRSRALSLTSWHLGSRLPTGGRAGPTRSGHGRDRAPALLGTTPTAPPRSPRAPDSPRGSRG